MNGISQMGGYGGQQLAPQGLFGSLLGGPVGGLIGRGIGGLFGNAGLGNQIGQLAGGIGGSILPFSADPMQAYAQQLAQQQQMQQLSPQGWIGNLIGQVGQPLGGAIGGLFGQSGLGNQIGGIASQLGRMLPFSADPMQQAYGQQQQFGPQGFLGNLIGQLGQPFANSIASTIGYPQLGAPLGGIASQLGRMLPFSADPMQQMQQGYSPQGWIGNLIGQVGQPLGGAIGGIFGQPNLGSQIGGIAGQLGRMLPFSADPMQQMQQGYSPQGWLGNLIGQVGQPLGGAIGGLFGQSGLGGQIGGIAGQLGRMLPFQMDPMQQMLAQQQMAQQLQQLQQIQQLAQQQQQQQQPYASQGQQNYSAGQTLH